MARAFSLLELVLVVMIIGVIGAIALPRFSSANESSHKRALYASHSVFQRAIEMYLAEHHGMSPGLDRTGSPVSSAVFAARLTGRTDADGSLNASGLFGPYLRASPLNVRNGRTSVRIDGADAGAATHGWHFDTRQNLILPDDSGASVNTVQNPGGNDGIF